MKKTGKVIVSLILALTLVFSATSLAFATPDEKCDCGHAPLVYVGGIGATIHLAEENGEERTVFPIENDKIIKEVILVIPVILVASVFGGWDGFGNTVNTLLTRLFADAMCDHTGHPVENTYVEESEIPTYDEHAAGDNRFHFEYDWRLDPYETAEKLDKYIDEVIAVTGHDRVILNGFSEGGEITFAYLDAYGSDKIEKYFAVSSAFQGLELIGQLFTKNCSISANGLSNFLEAFLPANGTSPEVAKLVGGLKYIGIYKAVEALGNLILDNCFDKIFYGFARDTFASMPGVFNFTPAKYYDKAVEMLFGDDPKYAELVAKYERYHKAQVNAEKILKEAQANGTAICLVSYYGYYPMPFIGDTTVHSDALIDSQRTSGGGTFAPLGQTLGDNYRQQVNDGHNHLSPDGCVDASTCMFPESTWIIKGFTHWTETCALTDWIMEFEGQPTIHDNPDFPQFLIGDQVTGELSIQK